MLSCTYPWTELHQTRFLGLLHAIAQESSVGNGKLPVLADWPGFGAFLALFWPARKRRYPALTPGPNCIKLVSWAYAGHFTGIWRWKLENTSISRLPLFSSLEQLLAVFRPARRRRCPAFPLGPNCTKLKFLGFCTPFHRNLVLETGKYQY